jgi:hypothetical protein
MLVTINSSVRSNDLINTPSLRLWNNPDNKNAIYNQHTGKDIKDPVPHYKLTHSSILEDIPIGDNRATR